LSVAELLIWTGLGGRGGVWLQQEQCEALQVGDMWCWVVPEGCFQRMNRKCKMWGMAAEQQGVVRLHEQYDALQVCNRCGVR
jgi:hypothetical protein